MLLIFNYQKKENITPNQIENHYKSHQVSSLKDTSKILAGTQNDAITQNEGRNKVSHILKKRLRYCELLVARMNHHSLELRNFFL